MYNIYLKNGVKEIYYKNNRIMKQIIVKIDKDLETGNQQLVINCTKDDDSTIRKIINHNQLVEKDTKFINDLEALIVENYGGLKNGNL